jgi:nitroreductase/FMN reductase [NAD(P)H]
MQPDAGMTDHVGLSDKQRNPGISEKQQDDVIKDAQASLAAVLEKRFGGSFDVSVAGEHALALAEMAGHAVHRKWSDRAVDPELVRLVIACALSAPSKSDLQQASIIHIQDKSQKARIADLVPQFTWFPHAPELMVFCGDGARTREIFRRAGQIFPNEHLDQFFNAVVDGTLVMQNFMRAASAVGLVYCPISVVRDRAVELDRILGLPSHVFPIAALCLGYPSQPGRVLPRLGLEATFHVDQYGVEKMGASLDAYDQRRIQSALSANVTGTPTAWTQDKLKQYAQPQRTDWGEYIRSKGFNLS